MMDTLVQFQDNGETVLLSKCQMHTTRLRGVHYAAPNTAALAVSVLKFISSSLSTITKTRLYNVYPLKPNFYIVKLGFTGVYIIFLISAQKHRLWVLVRTASARRF